MSPPSGYYRHNLSCRESPAGSVPFLPITKKSRQRPPPTASYPFPHSVANTKQTHEGSTARRAIFNNLSFVPLFMGMVHGPRGPRNKLGIPNRASSSRRWFLQPNANLEPSRSKELENRLRQIVASEPEGGARGRPERRGRVAPLAVRVSQTSAVDGAWGRWEETLEANTPRDDARCSSARGKRLNRI